MTVLQETDQWQSTRSPTMVRDMNGTEALMAAGASSGKASYTILPIILIKVQGNKTKAELSPILKAAWRALFFQISNLTITPQMQNGTATFLYNEKSSPTETNEWLLKTFSEECLADGEDNSKTLENHALDTNVKGISMTLGSSAKLQVYYFENSEGNVIHLGVVGCVNHYAFDGSGAYNLLDAFLQNAVISGGLQPKIYTSKAEPEMPMAVYFDSHVAQLDHSALTNELTQVFMSPKETHIVKRTETTGAASRPRGARYIFDEAKTKDLLVKVKSVGVTISQLAMAVFLLPLLGHFPAEKDAIISYAGTINLRSQDILPRPFYGNGIAGYVDQVNCYDLSRDLRSGGAVNSQQDAQGVLKIAKQFTENVHKHRGNAQEEAFALTKVIEDVISNMKPGSTPPSLPFIHNADGILDRYIKKQYEGSSLCFDVIDIHTNVLNFTGNLNIRTSTFANRLSLCITFNEEFWKGQEVDDILQKWATSIEKTLEFIG